MDSTDRPAPWGSVRRTPGRFQTPALGGATGEQRADTASPGRNQPADESRPAPYSQTRHPVPRASQPTHDIDPSTRTGNTGGVPGRNEPASVVRARDFLDGLGAGASSTRQVRQARELVAGWEKHHPTGPDRQEGRR